MRRDVHPEEADCDVETDPDIKVPDYGRVITRRIALCLAVCDDFSTEELMRLSRRNDKGKTRLRYIVEQHEATRQFRPAKQTRT